MMRLDRSFCLPAALLVGFGAVSSAAASAQIPAQPAPKTLLDSASTGVSTDASSKSTPASDTPAPSIADQQKNAELIGDTDLARQRYQAAIAAYSKAPQMNATLWNKIGIAYQMMFNDNEAMRCYQKSLKLDPHNADVLNNLATVYASMKDYGKAEHTRTAWRSNWPRNLR